MNLDIKIGKTTEEGFEVIAVLSLKAKEYNKIMDAVGCATLFLDTTLVFGSGMDLLIELDGYRVPHSLIVKNPTVQACREILACQQDVTEE